MAQADLFFPDRQSLFRKQHPENLLYFLMRSLLIFNFVKHIVSSFRMTLIPQGYGCRISHSRIYLISTTHSFCFLIVFSLAPYLSSTPRLPHHIYGREHYRRMLRFASLADFLKVLLITTWSPSSSLWEEIRIIIPRR